jgi:cell division protein FtsW
MVAKHSKSRQGSLLASGIFTLFAGQMIINLGSMVALFPLTGVPLPFISYGGSNLIISLIAVGIVLNVSKL